MPFFLLFQAACFKIPAILWKYFHGQSGMRVGEILRLATHESNTDPKIRSANINALCHHLEKVFKISPKAEIQENNTSQIFPDFEHQVFYLLRNYRLPCW